MIEEMNSKNLKISDENELHKHNLQEESLKFMRQI
jgi:hypothetical protein